MHLVSTLERSQPLNQAIVESITHFPRRECLSALSPRARGFIDMVDNGLVSHGHTTHDRLTEKPERYKITCHKSGFASRDARQLFAGYIGHVYR